MYIFIEYMYTNIIKRGVRRTSRRPMRSALPSLSLSALEATQGQMDGFFSQLPYKCNLEEVED